MYTEYFGLNEEPFSIAANPRFLYMSEYHREALAHLLYGIRSDSGFVLLTGEVGTGKTTVCRCLLEQLPRKTDVAFILNPRQNAIELLCSICDELGIPYPGYDPSIKRLVDAISRYAVATNAQGRSTVVIIDEAQNLSAEVLEQLRLLTNLETNERKLLRIILLGQPELTEQLARPELRQVEQRITARYHLKPLRRSEMNAYVNHRLAVAGRHEPVFSAHVLNRLHSRTGGVPRLINVVCDRAMLGAYVRSQRKVSSSILRKAVTEVRGNQTSAAWLVPASVAMFALLVSVAAGTAFMYSKDPFVQSDMAEHEEAMPIEPAMASVSEPQSAAVSELSPTLESEPELPAAAAEPLMVSEWPATAVAHDAATKHAYDTMFRIWSVPPHQSGRDPCLHAQRYGLRCFRSGGNFGTLLSTNRPAILTLRDKQGNVFEAPLTKLNGNSAIVAFADGEQLLDRDLLERHWFGEYLILWRMTPQGLTVLRPGDRGSGISWLSRNLVEAGAADPALGHNHYDNAMFVAVQAFQQRQGLVPDGIAGRQTLIRLNTLNDPSVPTLHQTAGG